MEYVSGLGLFLFSKMCNLVMLYILPGLLQATLQKVPSWTEPLQSGVYSVSGWVLLVLVSYDFVGLYLLSEGECSVNVSSNQVS